MRLQIHLLKGANGLLYLGPLVAGMSGFGWGMVASFTAIFVAWLIVLRPEQWPATWAEWRLATSWLSALTIVLSQVALIAVLFAIGRGLGALAGFLPVINPQVPLAISFMAIPLGRMLWNAGEAADRGIFLDEEAEAASAPRVAAAAASAIVPLLNFADDAPDRIVAKAVSEVMASTSAELRLKALAATLAQPGRSHAALRRTLILWASEPEVVVLGAVPQAMSLAYLIADRNGDLLRLYVPRALALIAAFPERSSGFPSPAILREASKPGLGDETFADLPKGILSDLQDGLRALAAAVEMARATVPKAIPELALQAV